MEARLGPVLDVLDDGEDAPLVVLALRALGEARAELRGLALLQEVVRIHL